MPYRGPLRSGSFCSSERMDSWRGHPTTVRFSPRPRDLSVKRSSYRSCSSLLISGRTCTQRWRRCKRKRWTVQTCLTCQHSQQFLSNSRHQLWADWPEAQLWSQADPKPPQSLASTAHFIPPRLPTEKRQPQSTSHQ